MSAIDGEEIGNQDIGGWIVMPPDHWEATVRYIKTLQAAAAVDKLPEVVD